MRPIETEIPPETPPGCPQASPAGAARRLVPGALALALLAAPAGAAVKITSHRAVYDVGIQTSSSGSPVQSVAGLTAFTMQRHCDGWQAVEDYALSFGMENGESNLISHYESWESMNGMAFSFSVHENTSTSGEARFHGFAHRSDNEGEAYFINGEDSTMALPDDTVFPVTHMRQLLEKAREGGKFLQSTLFIGGEEDDSLYHVSSVIGIRQQESQPVLGPLGQDGYWPLRLAYFDPGSLESIPEYEIELDMQENGVIRSYIIDYGEFSMSGSLKSIEALQEPEC